MRKSILGLLIVAAVGLSPHAASATKIIILSGTHSEGDVAKACAGVGGKSWSSSGGYGCVNPSNGNNVSCNSNGKCTGQITRTTGGPSRPTLNGTLGSPPSSALSKSGQPTLPTHAGTGPTVPPGPPNPPTARTK
jgi:hypothetical protein